MDFEPKTPGIFLVLGDTINFNENVKSFADTLVVPNVNDTIRFKDKLYTVTRRLIDYKQVDNYNLEDEGRGAELIYLYVKEEFYI